MIYLLPSYSFSWTINTFLCLCLGSLSLSILSLSLSLSLYWYFSLSLPLSILVLILLRSGEDPIRLSLVANCASQRNPVTQIPFPATLLLHCTALHCCCARQWDNLCKLSAAVNVVCIGKKHFGLLRQQAGDLLLHSLSGWEREGGSSSGTIGHCCNAFCKPGRSQTPFLKVSLYSSTLWPIARLF